MPAKTRKKRASPLKSEDKIEETSPKKQKISKSGPDFKITIEHCKS
ncbi:hypothetical protein MAR_008027 [Mya arenaria]|uniref:Uncharacterized protein n=1 Tax=Mya arenaria TaxID=6604 RepID=A0ABY7DX46_MYAAR|nr:hypothetical protein MAR_008027 [Mya arenaria]